MTNHINRPARSNLVVPLTFKTEDLLLEGVSVNVSESGLLALFDEPLGIWIIGEISMVVGEYMVSIQARTARIHGEYVGLSFLIESDNDRLTINLINDYAMTLKQGDVPDEDPSPGSRPPLEGKNERGRS